MPYLIARHCAFWLLFNLLHWSRIPRHVGDMDGRFWRFYCWLAGGCYSLDDDLYAYRHGVR